MEFALSCGELPSLGAVSYSGVFPVFHCHDSVVCRVAPVRAFQPRAGVADAESAVHAAGAIRSGGKVGHCFPYDRGRARILSFGFCVYRVYGLSRYAKV